MSNGFDIASALASGLRDRHHAFSDMVLEESLWNAKALIMLDRRFH